MIKVLFVHYFDKNGLVNNYENNLIGSFLSAFENNPYYQYDVHHIGLEEDDIKNSEQLNHSLLTKNFDIALVTEHFEIQLDLETVKKLKKKLFICNWDCFVTKNSWSLYNDFLCYISGHHMNNLSKDKKKYSLKDLSEYCNILNFDYGIDEFFPNIFGMMCPQDTRMFFPSSEENKVYDVLFNGNIHMKERADHINKIYNSGIDIKTTGGFLKPEMLLPLAYYADQHRKAKISLSFNGSMFFGVQRKGRISEILASKSMCAMTHPLVLSFYDKKWMQDGVHYISIDIENCVEKINYYLQNPVERIRIAESGYNYFMEHFSPLVFWKKIFEIAGVK